MREAIRHEPTLRMAQGAFTRDAAKDRFDKVDRERHTRRILAKQLVHFLLKEDTIKFEEKKYLNETTIFASLWTVADNSPNLDGRKADIEDARKRGRAEAAREILDAATAPALSVKPWQYVAHEIIREWENRSGD